MAVSFVFDGLIQSDCIALGMNCEEGVFSTNGSMNVVSRIEVMG